MGDATKANISFGFSKTVEPKKLRETKFKTEEGPETKEEVDFVQSVSDKQINGSIKKQEKKELVIPLITQNRWRVGEQKEKQTETDGKTDENLSLDELAARELLAESRKLSDDDIAEAKKNGDFAIPLFMQNRAPAGYETDEKMDVSLRADESTLDDYESVPIEQFGLAVLRGMGWNPNEGIGARNKKVIAPVEVNLRPKGLGLGADRRVLQSAKNVPSSEKNEEDLKIVKGAYVFVTGGKQQGLYGQIESLDENTGRAVVKMAVGGQSMSISELCLKPVAYKEFKDSSRVLNKEKYDEYKAKQDKQKEREEEERRKQKKSKKERRRSRSRSRSKDRSKDRDDRTDKKKSHKDSERKKEKERKATWAMPSLRVRCVDKKYKEGRYFSKKMVVVDVISEEICICKSEEGRLLDNVPTTTLETVIPRSTPYVMIVAGRRRGQVAEILERDKERCQATVQVLPDRDEIVKIEYDSICEFTGDVHSL